MGQGLPGDSSDPLPTFLESWVRVVEEPSLSLLGEAEAGNLVLTFHTPTSQVCQVTWPRPHPPLWPGELPTPPQTPFLGLR